MYNFTDIEQYWNHLGGMMVILNILDITILRINLIIFFIDVLIVESYIPDKYPSIVKYIPDVIPALV